MDKAVLVMDTPDGCYFCPCFDLIYHTPHCKILNKSFSIGEDLDFLKTRQDWCPLKPLPEEDNKEEYFCEWSRGYQAGWNDCINAIVGE